MLPRRLLYAFNKKCKKVVAKVNRNNPYGLCTSDSTFGKMIWSVVHLLCHFKYVLLSALPDAAPVIDRPVNRSLGNTAGFCKFLNCT